MTTHDAHDGDHDEAAKGERAPGASPAEWKDPARAAIALRSHDLMSPELLLGGGLVDAEQVADSLDELLDAIEDGEMAADPTAVAYLYGARHALRALSGPVAVHKTTV